MKKIAAIDQYIEKQATFAQPILHKLRAVVEQASGDIEEAIKWRAPCYSKDGLVCAMAGFKAHVNFSFFNGKSINDTRQLFEANDNETLTALKFSTVEDIPEDKVLIGYIQQAIEINQSTSKPKPPAAKKDKATLVIPDDLQQALNANDAARQYFSAFSYSKQKDYIDWLTSAKREATRLKRLTTAIEWIGEGKGRNWKYENC